MDEYMFSRPLKKFCSFLKKADIILLIGLLRYIFPLATVSEVMY